MNEVLEDAQWVMTYLVAIERTGQHAPTETMQRVIDALTQTITLPEPKTAL